MGGSNNNKRYQGKNNNYNKKNYNKDNGKNYKNKNKIESLEETNSFDIIIDDERLKDKESLDVSFVDGKGKRKKKAAEQAIEILEEEIDYKEEVKKLDVPEKRKNEVVSTFLIILFSLILGFLLCYLWATKTDALKSIKTITKIKTEVETKVVMDENIVFLGDSIFECYDVEKYYEGMHVVNSGISGHTTADILSNMNERVYQYNPSKVILLIGTNDLNKDVEQETIVENMGKIIDGIKKNRPYAEIYVQSVYPVNRSDDEKISLSSVGKRRNSTIMEMNSNIRKLCEEKEVTYMNIYDVLVNEEGEIDLEYTKEGLHITEKGYEIITEEVMKYISEEKVS